MQKGPRRRKATETLPNFLFLMLMLKISHPQPHLHTRFSREELRAKHRKRSQILTQPRADAAHWELILCHVCPTCSEEPPALLQPQHCITAQHHPPKENHRMAGVGRDLCGSSSPIPLPKSACFGDTKKIQETTTSSQHPTTSSPEPYPADPQLHWLIPDFHPQMRGWVRPRRLITALLPEHRCSPYRLPAARMFLAVTRSRSKQTQTATSLTEKPMRETTASREQAPVLT